MLITGEDIILKNGTINYNILSEPETPGQFNVNHFSVYNFNFKANAYFQSIGDMKANIDILSFVENNSGLYLNNLKANVTGKGSNWKAIMFRLV